MNDLMVVKSHSGERFPYDEVLAFIANEWRPIQIGIKEWGDMLQVCRQRADAFASLIELLEDERTLGFQMLEEPFAEGMVADGQLIVKSYADSERTDALLSQLADRFQLRIIRLTAFVSRDGRDGDN